MRHIAIIMILATCSVFLAQAKNDTVAVVQADSSVVHYAITDAGIQKITDTPAAENKGKAKRFWLEQLKKGKTYFNDSTVHYPRFIRTCYNLYKWGDKTFNSYDTTYVKSTGMNWKVILKNNNWFDFFQCRPMENVEMRFYNTAPSTTIGAYVSFMALSVGYAIDLDKLLGRQITSRKFEFSFTCARFFAEFYRTHNTGKMNVTTKDLKDKEKYEIKNYEGLRRKSWGINAYYFLNHNKYAQAASYCYSKYQRRSAGSMLVGFNVSHQDIYFDAAKATTEFVTENGETVKIPEEELQNETIFNYTDYCLSFGYGYNWVLGKKWLLNGTAIVYPGLKHALAHASSDGGSNYFAINFKAKVGVTYSHRHFFASLVGNFDSHMYNTGKYRFSSVLADLSLITGFRF